MNVKSILSLLIVLLITTSIMNAQESEFISEDVSFTNGDVTLVGTLTIPNTDADVFPAIVVVSGSGPQDRDGVSLGFMPEYQPSLFLAEALTPEGFAVLRFDERGVGESTGNHNETSGATHASDVEAAVDYLISRNDIDSEQIGLIGHSEGSNTVIMVTAHKPEIAFVVSLAGQAVSGQDLILAQAEAVPRVDGASEAEIAAAIQFVRDEFEIVLAEDWERLAEKSYEIFDALPEEQQPSPEVQAQLIADQEIHAINWYLPYLSYNPADDLVNIDVPFLAIFAELDTQVPLEQNLPALQATLDDAMTTDYEIVILEDTNHLFQPNAETGSPQEYTTLPSEFTPVLIETLLDWLHDHVELS